MSRERVVLATCRAWPELSLSDRRFAEALERRGFLVESAQWNGPFAPFDGARAVVIRSTWDYHESLDDYRAWLGQLDPRAHSICPIWCAGTSTRAI